MPKAERTKSSPSKTVGKPYHLGNSPSSVGDKIGPSKLTFGKYKGQTLKEIHANDPGYISNWLVPQQNDIAKRYPYLKAALEAFHNDIRAFPSERDPDWNPQPLKSSPFIRNEWISEYDASNIFGLPSQCLIGMPSAGWKKFWLFHVWDCLKWHRGEKEADMRLNNFYDKNERATQDIYGKLGLGLSECFDNGEDSGDGESDESDESDKSDESDEEKSNFAKEVKKVTREMESEEYLDCREPTEEEMEFEEDYLGDYEPTEEEMEEFKRERGGSEALEEIVCGLDEIGDDETF